MYIKRDGSIHGPLWPREIKSIVLDMLEKRVGYSFTVNLSLFLVYRIRNNQEADHATKNVILHKKFLSL